MRVRVYCGPEIFCVPEFVAHVTPIVKSGRFPFLLCAPSPRMCLSSLPSPESGQCNKTVLKLRKKIVRLEKKTRKKIVSLFYDSRVADVLRRCRTQ